MILQRIAREYLAQLLGLAVSLFDRIVLVGMMVRIWGVEGFADWTVAMSTAGMVSALDFGLVAYFGNRLFFLVEQGKRDEAKRVFREGNLLLIIASVTGTVAVLAIFLSRGNSAHSSLSLSQMVVALALLAAATAGRQAIGLVYALYRAHQQFSRQTWLLAVGDLLRIVLMVALLLGGFNLLALAISFAVSTLVFSIAVPLLDTRRRFPDFHFAVAIPEADARRSAMSTSLQYWTQSAINTGITFLPVLLLDRSGASAIIIARFAFIRTMANFIRTVLSLFINVFGLEAARRIAIADAGGLSSIYRDSTIFLAVQLGGLAGILAVLASPVFLVWTGNPAIYDGTLFWWALIPLVLFPSLAMATQTLTCANLPTPLMQGRISQFVITLAAYFIAPIPDVALRMMVALAIGEVVGMGWPVMRSAHRLVENSGLRLHSELLARGALSCGLCGGITLLGSEVLDLQGWPALATLLAISASALGGATFLLGVSADRRSALWKSVNSRFTRA